MSSPRASLMARHAFTAQVGAEPAVKLLNADSYTTWPDSRFSGYAGEGGKTITNELSVGETHGVYPADTGSGAVDTVLPEVSSVERVSGFDTGVSAADHITNSDTVVFKVTFTETVDVSTLSGADFELVGTPALAGVVAPTISVAENADGPDTGGGHRRCLRQGHRRRPRRLYRRPDPRPG